MMMLNELERPARFRRRSALDGVEGGAFVVSKDMSVEASAALLNLLVDAIREATRGEKIWLDADVPRTGVAGA